MVLFSKLIGIMLALCAVYGLTSMVREYRRSLPLGLKPYFFVKWIIAIYVVLTFPTVFLINYYVWK